LAHLKPHRGDPTSSSFIFESRPRGFLHAPPCGLAPSCLGFSARDYPAKMLETTWSGFYWWGIGPCLVLWSNTCPGWLSPVNGDLGSTQILTRHYGAQSQTISQLQSSGTTPTSNSPQLSPCGLSKHLRTGSVRMSHHILTTRMEPCGFMKLSAQTYTLHMKLSLRLSISAQTKPQGLCSGHHHRILKPDHEGLKPHNHTSESRGGPHNII
jgi:hypothetical protein